MASPVVVEVLDNRGRVHGRTRLERFPATIGRGYGNDVIIDDPFSDAEHLRVVEDGDGSLVAEDAGSINGTFVGATRTRAARTPIRPGLELRVGRTTLRFQDPAQPVRPAILDRGGDVPAWLESRKVAAVVVLVGGIVYALTSWLGSYERTTAAKLVNSTVAIFLVIGVWAGLWALVTRVNRQRFNFRSHFVLAIVVSVLFGAASALATWVSAVAPNADMDAIVMLLVETPLGLLLLTGHLALATGLGRAARVRAAAFILVGGFAMIGLKAWADRDDFTTDMKYNATIRPVPVGMLHTVPVTEFFKDAAELRVETDSLAAKANRESERR